MFLTQNDVSRSLGLPQQGAEQMPPPPAYSAADQDPQRLRQRFAAPGPDPSLFGGAGGGSTMLGSMFLTPPDVSRSLGMGGPQQGGMPPPRQTPRMPGREPPPPPFAVPLPEDSSGPMAGQWIPNSLGPAGGKHTVQQGEMAYNIAKQILGPGASHQQLMAFVQRLAEANPDAFYGGDKLRAGAQLNVDLPPPGPRSRPMGTQGPAMPQGPMAEEGPPRGTRRPAPM